MMDWVTPKTISTPLSQFPDRFETRHFSVLSLANINNWNSGVTAWEPATGDRYFMKQCCPLFNKSMGYLQDIIANGMSSQLAFIYRNG
ncbi:hypothetical protein AH4AK4_4047 [Aeromonas hydrophila 4AK4]|nr:hypothetical protein AH4AK4_4047 [Aeromonas hydrophila 4AK4]